MNFKNFISKRMDNLLKEEDLNPPLVKYIHVDLMEKQSQVMLRAKAMELVSHVSDTPVYDPTHACRIGYSKLIELILLVDMPLDRLFDKEMNLDELYAKYKDVPNASVISGFIEGLGRAFKNPLDEVQLFDHLKWAHLFYIGLAKRLGVTAEKLLA